MLGLSELAILLIVVVVFLGAKKLPDLARSAGKAARILKSETKAMKSEAKTSGTSAADPRSPSPQVIRVRPGDTTTVRPGGGTDGGPAGS
ncbi:MULTISPECIES: twin-arginine translocase TatA/TatE family subunit [unclassified Streptomyces]|uniref:twin-arginine translocase TatA/TatE family subunit n=1 Tax=unclassified Streptomyces TaxID=2593676 RepID=UPI002DDC6C26|nr:twin-arginine translocase TatA/TatE family subunit [Streptomyces sp. NBC_01237]WRZ73966.1 twin-arginine translocase TatA/TatE family subunit [Streptomyces sp. NBC_01237]